MSFVIPTNPDAGIGNDVTVRTATIDGFKFVSAIDIIKVVVNPTTNPYEYWTRTSTGYPELSSGVRIHKFPGAGQRDTPVIDARQVVMLLNILPGKRAASFRKFSADIVVRYLGGDDSLVAEINKNAEFQETLPENDPRSIFGQDAKRKREQREDEEFDLRMQGARLKLINDGFELVKTATAILKELGNGLIDGPTELLLKDATRNVIAPLSRRLATNINDGNTSESETSIRHQIPISDLYRQVTGHTGDKKTWVRLGTLVAKEYRRRHTGQNPAEVERFIDGTTRMIKAYSLYEDPWLLDFIRENIQSS